MVYVRVPAAVSSLFRDILETMHLALAGNVTAQAAYTAIVTLGTSYPIPKKWLVPNYASYGGSPLCQEFISSKPVTGGLTGLLSYGLPCLPTSPIQSKVIPTRQHYIVSAIVSGLVSQQPVNFTRICSYDPAYLALCLVYLNRTNAFTQTYMSTANSTFFASASAATAAVQALNIEFMFFTKVNSTAPLTLLHTNVLDPGDPGFHFFGWTYLYDWVVGNREAVAFQGDTGNLTILTDLELPLLQQAREWELTANIARYFQAAVLFVTVAILVVAVGTTLYMIVSRGRFVGLNMLKLERVGAIVWVGRPLLFLRSLTALCLLSTGSLDLTFSGYVSALRKPPTSNPKLLLAAWEVTWLALVLDDVLVVYTRQHARYYVQLNCVTLWAATTALSMSEPVSVVFTLATSCYITEMDLQIVCTAGTIDDGHVGRLITLVVLVVVCDVACFLFIRALWRDVPPCPAHSRHLTAAAKYFYSHHQRIVDDVYYLDRASAMINGMLTYRRGDTIYALDIQLWRVFATPARPPHARTHGRKDLAAALPLGNLP
ncbi:hypothetical protein ACHHYP_04600 [Achlya hypogyna]|uniref:Transmembrane protein n=1 Tax=Achlya hypogyna TaxID=1202772 RepID=A0A1V9Z0Q9_ACHHY|nr:hypothetical protein ACHHYP_04600 [Achlya hypogyna]